MGTASDLVEVGRYSRLAAQILRQRLETAGIPVLLRWVDGDSLSGDGAPSVLAVLAVPVEHADFAYAVVNEIDIDDEVPDTSPYAYVVRIEEHLAAAAELLDELRTRLDELER